MSVGIEIPISNRPTNRNIANSKPLQADSESNRWNPISNQDQRKEHSNQPFPTSQPPIYIITKYLIINYLTNYAVFEKFCSVGRLVGWTHFLRSVNFKTCFYSPPFLIGVFGEKREGRHLTMATLQINTYTI